MGAKDNWTPLAGAGLLDEQDVRKLHGYGITTVEELAGQLASGDDALGQLLGIQDQRLARLKSDALDALPGRTHRDFAEAADLVLPPPGALNPGND